MTLVRSVRPPYRPQRFTRACTVAGCIAIPLLLVALIVMPRIGDGIGTSPTKLGRIHTDELIDRWRREDPGCRAPAFLSREDSRDPWGKEVRFLCDAVDRDRRAVMSAGEDRAFGTADDVTSWR